MIELSIAQLAVGVIGASMILVGGALWISRWSHAKAERRGVRSRVICRLCQHVYEERSGVAHPRCPACGAVNDRRRG